MNTILLTGATGNLGSRILVEFLKDPNIRFKLLVFGKDQKDVEEQIDKILLFWGANPVLKNRIDPLVGDMTAGEYLGFSKETYLELAKEVTHIIHCAANFKLDLSLEDARKSIVEGTKYLVLFGKKCQEENRSFKRFNYISSLDAAGDLQGEIKEEFLGDKQKGYLNTYQAAKAEAEELLQNEYIENNFPITVYRPSMLVGDSENGKIINPQSLYHIINDMFLNPESMVLPGKDFRVDPMPINFLAEGIYQMYDSNETLGKVYHFVSGQNASLTLPKLIDKLQIIYSNTTGKLIPKPIFISPQIPFVLLSVGYFLTLGKVKKSLYLKREMMRYLFLNTNPDNTQMKNFLESRGLKLPLLKDYLQILCEYMIQEKKKLAVLQEGAIK